MLRVFTWTCGRGTIHRTAPLSPRVSWSRWFAWLRPGLDWSWGKCPLRRTQRRWWRSWSTGTAVSCGRGHAVAAFTNWSLRISWYLQSYVGHVHSVGWGLCVGPFQKIPCRMGSHMLIMWTRLCCSVSQLNALGGYLVSAVAVVRRLVHSVVWRIACVTMTILLNTLPRG